MKIILHPTCFPSIATFAAIVQHDVIWEAHDNFQKQTYRNRCYICTDQGKHMLTIPVRHVGGTEGRQKYGDVEMDNSYDWKKLHWRTLETAYRTSPFFEFYEDEIQPLFHGSESNLFEFNLRTIAIIAGCLDIEVPKEKTNTYETDITDHFDARILVQAKKGKTHDFETYPQVFEDRHSFVPNVSVLDLLFNEGPNSIAYLRKQELNLTDD